MTITYPARVVISPAMRAKLGPDQAYVQAVRDLGKAMLAPYRQALCADPTVEITLSMRVVPLGKGMPAVEEAPVGCVP